MNEIKKLCLLTRLADTLYLIENGIKYESEKDLEQGLKLLRTAHDSIQQLVEFNDPINPNHYKTDSGVSCIDIAELFPYSLGNAIKYAWRAGKKGGLNQDLEKCEWYLDRAMANGEDSLFLNNDKAVLRARRLFAELNRTDLPELNYELIDRILNVSLEYALIYIDDCFVGER